MGAVYEALDERLDTTVALKETLFTDERLRKQFEREARLLARMHHPALPRVSDHFNEADGQFLVMQYIAGEDLFAMLAERNGPFPQDEVLLWADQLCDALDYLHTQDPQIIHRDIKPQNLKLTARGQIVLLDFGLAKGSAGQMSVVTTSASIFGYTPNYAPLEQVQGLGTDPRSDIYAFAATLFHLMTNVKPPDALSRASAIVNGLPDPLPLANRVTPQVGAAVAAVLHKGMSQKRDDRFATANAMRGALKIAAEHPHGEAATVLIAAAQADGAALAAEPATKLTGEQTNALGSEAQTLLGADATSVHKQSLSSETVTLVHPVPRGKSSRGWLGAALLLVLLVGGAAGFYAYRVRRQTQQSPATAAPVQAPQSNQAAPSEPGNSNEIKSAQVDAPKINESKPEKRVEGSQRAATTKQTESSVPAKVPATQPSTAHEADRNPDRGNVGAPRQYPPPQAPPEFDPSRNPRGRQPGHPPGNGEAPNVRTLPNGTRVVTQPDGTRIFTGPKGRVQVVPPGEKPNRKRNRP
ncbi:MAG: eukaryotic-like serine/threonine-protein kinase [Blastocatellia bacterium]|nr:eukaryotic-like serine/threonine-protein kinase [Blastocatellia bacterium]